MTVDIYERIKDERKKRAWITWGDGFVKWMRSYQVYPMALTPQRVSEAFSIVANSPGLWPVELKDLIEEKKVEGADAVESIKSGLLEQAETIRGLEFVSNIKGEKKDFISRLHLLNFLSIKEGIMELEVRGTEVPFSLPFQIVVGVLRWHFRYFLGWGDIYKTLHEVLDKKIDTIKKILFRASYKEEDYLRKYKFLVSIYTDQKVKNVVGENIIKEVVREVERFEEWYKLEAERLNRKIARGGQPKRELPGC